MENLKKSQKSLKVKRDIIENDFKLPDNSFLEINLTKKISKNSKNNFLKNNKNKKNRGTTIKDPLNNFEKMKILKNSKKTKFRKKKKILKILKRGNI